MEGSSIVIKRSALKVRIVLFQLRYDILLKSMCEPDVYYKMLKEIIAPDIVQDYELVVADKELVGDTAWDPGLITRRVKSVFWLIDHDHCPAGVHILFES